MAEASRGEVARTGTSRAAGSIKELLLDNSVPLLFVAICLAGVYFSKLPLLFIVDTLLSRITRNSFLVLSLVIPVVAGLGLNFGIVIGAMAGQFAIIAVTHFKVSGPPGFLLCIALSTPLAILFGILTGMLLNRTKGQEMISSMIAGFFANGVYQFVLLFLVGTLIPLKNPDLVLSRGIGIRNTIDLWNLSTGTGLKYSLDGVFRLPLFHVFAAVSLAAIAFAFIDYYCRRRRGGAYATFRLLFRLLSGMAVLAVSLVVIIARLPLVSVKLPIATALLIVALYGFNSLILTTKLGQSLRTVGQDIHIAKVSGINVDRVRTIAVTLSILFAAWGQIIFLQDIGVLSTYGSHVQIATFSIAAILLGGASVARATSGQAILGVILFHTLFIVSPKAGNNLFGEAQIGEFFRAFVSYGVIGVALGLHAWNKALQAARSRAASRREQ